MGIGAKVLLNTRSYRSIAYSIKLRVTQICVALLVVNIEILLKICKVSFELAPRDYCVKQQTGLIIVDIAEQVWVLDLIGSSWSGLLV